MAAVVGDPGAHLPAKGGHSSAHLLTLVPTREDSQESADFEVDGDGRVWVNVRKAGHLTGLADRGVKKACQEGRVVTRMVRGNGGMQYRILLSSLGPGAEIKFRQEQTAAVPVAAPAPEREIAVPERARRTAMLKADLIRLYLQETETVHGSKVASKRLFVERYLAGEWPHLLAELGPRDYKTLERWRKEVRDAGGDPIALAPRYGAAGKAVASGTVTATQGAIITKYALSPNAYKISEIIRLSREEFGARGIHCDAADITLRRYVEKLRKHNFDVWTLQREGEKALNDKVLPYITRDRKAVEVGDIVFADGHVLNFLIQGEKRARRMTLLMVFDFRTGAPIGWEIMPTESTLAIAAAYRRAILNLGFVPALFYLDNGRAFKSRFFTKTPDFEQSGVSGLFDRLGTQVRFAQPYHGQTKTVERFFGVLAEMERRMPSYVGTDIASKPAHMKRGEFHHRKLREELHIPGAVTLTEAYEALDQWIGEYMHRPQDGALNGRTPAQELSASLERVKARPDYAARVIEPDRLNYLMMAEEVKTLDRNGIRFGGEYYYAPEMYRLEKGKGARARFIIRYDLADRSSVLVYTPNGDFLCEATMQMKHHPAAKDLGTPENVIALNSALTEKSDLRRGTAARARAFVRRTMQGDASLHLPESEAHRRTGTDNVIALDAGPVAPRRALFESDDE